MQPVEIFVLGKKVRLLQPASGFRTSLDSVVLAAACPAADGERILDMGCGVGGVSLCLLHRLPDCLVTGVDKEAEYIELAKENAILNARRDACVFIQSDIRAFSVAGPRDRFDHIVCNPPYLESGHYTPSPVPGRATALGHLDEDICLTDWCEKGFSLLKSGGSLTLIHRADMTDRIIQALGRRFGAVEIIPLWPHAGEPARRVIVRAVKDRKSPAALRAGLVLHEPDGSYTAAADAILRDGFFLQG